MLKKAMLLLIGVMLVSGGAFTGFAAGASPVYREKVGGINADRFSELLETVASNGEIESAAGKIENAADLAVLTARPNDEITLKLRADMFLDRNGAPIVSTGAIAYSAISSDIQLRTRGKGGNIASFVLTGDSGGSRVEIGFSESIAHIGDNFEYEFCLTSRNGKEDSPYVAVGGTFETELSRGESGNSFDTSGGEGVEVIGGSVSNVVFELGEGITLTRRTLPNGKYYGVARADTEIDVTGEYPAVEYVYRLETSRLKTAGNIVNLNAGGSYHVYNTYGEYIGTSSSALPYWTTYYLSTQKYDRLELG